MGFPRQPVRPLASGFKAIRGPFKDPWLWLPFVVLAGVKALVLVGIARLDLLPAFLLAPCLALAPSIERVLHYPQLVMRLPTVTRLLDLGVFFTVGLLVQAFAILRLARAWGADPPPFWEGPRRTAGKLFGLGSLALLIAGVPAAAMQLAHGLGSRSGAVAVGLVAGGVASMLLFVAPVFYLVHRASLRTSLAASVGLFPQLPIALPLAVLLLAGLHAPALVLRMPAIRAGVAADPDWILLALLGQLPAEILGGVLAAGLATYFGLRTRFRGSPLPALGSPVMLVLLGVVLTTLTGCDTRRAADVRRRYAAERLLERAHLRADALRESEVEADSSAYLAVAALYGRAIDRLGIERRTDRGTDAVQHELGKLVCQALLGRAAAWRDAGRREGSIRDYRTLLDSTTVYRGVRADAALELARTQDAFDDWRAAHRSYVRWLSGVENGDWPLHASGLAVPAYVSRRLRDRGARADRQAWVDLSTAALQSAARRGELPREARTALFGLLLGVQRWDDAYATLRLLRAEHDPEGRDGGLLVAEASLLAGGLGRQSEAVGILQSLAAEGSPYDSEHRVASWLLLGEIHTRNGRFDAAQKAYEGALSTARSDGGRSEALLGLARTLASQNDLPRARREYARLRELYPATAAGLLAPLEEIRLLRAAGETAEAQALVPVALQEYRQVILHFGTELPALRAARAMSECMGLSGDWNGGVAFLDSIAPSFGGDPRAGTLLAFAARLSVERLQDRSRAERLLATLDTRYPTSDVAVLAHAYADSLGLRTP